MRKKVKQYSLSSSTLKFKSIEELMRVEGKDREFGDSDKFNICLTSPPSFEIIFMSYLHELPHCCGVLEFGNIATHNIENKDLKAIVDNFPEIVEKPVIINAAKYSASWELLPHLKASPHWEQIAEFVNSGTGNKIVSFILKTWKKT